MKPIQHYINQRINLKNKVGSPAQAAVDQLILDKVGIPAFCKWCNQDFLKLGSAESLVGLQGFDTKEKRVAFFNENRALMQALITETRSRKQGSVSDIVPISSSLLMSGDVAAKMMEEDLFMSDFVQHHILKFGFEIRTKVLLPYLHLLREDRALKEKESAKN